MNNLSAKDFQGPLLQVLGDLSGRAVGVPVPGKDTYAPVMALLGIADINTYGTEDLSGTPMVQRWISWACKNLRHTGHIELGGRGMWMLTHKGLQELSTMNTATAPVVVDPQVIPAVTRPQYLKDPYVRGLVFEQTPCLGHYTSHKGAVCVTCPIATECQDILYNAYAKAASALAVEDQAANLRASIAKAAPTTPVAATTTPVATRATPVATRATPVAATITPAAATITPVATRAKLNLDTALRITAFEDVSCTECGKVILQNEYMIWVEDLSGTGLTAHVACFAAIQ